MVLSAALCWSIYKSSNEIGDAFVMFTDDDLKTLDHLIGVRAGLGEYERALYEYYATTDLAPLQDRLSRLQRSVQQHLDALRGRFAEHAGYQTLVKVYTGFQEEYRQLEIIIEDPATYWDAARASLVRLSDHGRDAVPALDRLFQDVSTSSNTSKGKVEKTLEKITLLVLGFVIVVIFTFIAVGYFTRATLKAEKEMLKSETKFRKVLESAFDGILMVNEAGIIQLANQQLLKMTGYSNEELLGKNVAMLIPERFTDHDQHMKRFFTGPLTRQMGKGLDLYIRHKDGSDIPVDISLNPIMTDEGIIVDVEVRDITEQKKTDALLTYQANYDSLTGLINRHEFERRVERLLSTIKIDKSEHALCFMDLDQFKVVNDTCGHIAGDEMLRQLGQILQHKVRQRDTLARLGGDEFGVLMEHCSLDDAHRVATTLQKAIQEFQFLWEEKYFKVGVSIGLVAVTDGVANLTELLKDADTACYIAKDKGRNRIHVYHTEDSEVAKRHGEMQWVTRVYKALEENRFALYAQPIIPLDGSRGIHYELLLKMIDEEGNSIDPGNFLPSTERYNLISKIDRWVVEHTFNRLVNHPDFLNSITFCSINISGQSLTEDDFSRFVIKQLLRSGVDSKKICFEITETAAISNLSTAKNFISTIKEHGCQFALDDFGSGLSSFGYLKNLPVDYLKIDGMFIRDIVKDPINHAMVKSINDIGHVMQMKTIAEFVENDEIKGMLREIGVNYAQGYGIGKPRLLDNILAKTGNVVQIKKARTEKTES